MQTIFYRNKKYPIRTLTMLIDGEEVTNTIASESLANTFGESIYKSNTKAQKIDETIYYYVPDDVIHLDAKEICNNHLDEKIRFISE